MRRQPEQSNTPSFAFRGGRTFGGRPHTGTPRSHSPSWFFSWFFQLCGDKQASRIRPQTPLLVPKGGTGLAPNPLPIRALPHLSPLSLSRRYFPGSHMTRALAAFGRNQPRVYERVMESGPNQRRNDRTASSGGLIEPTQGKHDVFWHRF